MNKYCNFRRCKLCLSAILIFSWLVMFYGPFYQKYSPRHSKPLNLPTDTPTCENETTTLHSCPPRPPNLSGRLKINETISLHDAVKALENKVLPGGSYEPSECLARWKVAILICFRNRDEHLGPFHYHIHTFLQKQQLKYTIYLINQTDNKPFNRAKLFNVGFVESLKDGHFDCFVFHDVDFLPEDDRHLYHCSDMPRHMTVYYDNHPYRNEDDFQRYFGGVVMLTGQHLRMINGWSNSYWGWGGEDDDFKARVLKHNLTIWSYPKDIGHYKMLSHKESPKNPIRYNMLKNTQKMMLRDGLNSLKYKLISKIKHPLFTSINVDLR